MRSAAPPFEAVGGSRFPPRRFRECQLRFRAVGPGARVDGVKQQADPGFPVAQGERQPGFGTDPARDMKTRSAEGATCAAGQTRGSGEFVPLAWADVGLAEDAAQGANWDLEFPGHDGSIDDILRIPHELDVAALLAGFDEAGRFKPVLDFAEG